MDAGSPNAKQASTELHTISQVIDRMRTLEAALPESAGLLAFHRMYRRVTERVAAAPRAAWEAPVWIEQLTVTFAGLYLGPLEQALADPEGARVTAAWRPFFAANGRAPLRFCFAGMNAHINRDLAVAVVRASAALGVTPRSGSPEHADFLAINRILEEVEVEILAEVAPAAVRTIGLALGPVDDKLALWGIAFARDLAWHNALLLWRFRSRPSIQARLVATLDALVGGIGRAVLLGVSRRVPLASLPQLPGLHAA